MQTSYIKYGRRHPIPSTAQILDELKTGFVTGYVPVSQGYRKPVEQTHGATDEKSLS